MKIVNIDNMSIEEGETICNALLSDGYQLIGQSYYGRLIFFKGNLSQWNKTDTAPRNLDSSIGNIF